MPSSRSPLHLLIEVNLITITIKCQYLYCVCAAPCPAPLGQRRVNSFTAEGKRLSDMTKARQEVRFQDTNTKLRLVLVPLPASLHHIGFLRHPQKGLCSPCPVSG